MKYKGVIFDLDGTLFDSMVFWDNVGEHFLAKYGAVPKPDFRDKFYVLSTDETIDMFINEYGVTETHESVMRMMLDDVGEFYRERVRMKPGAREFMDVLRARGVPMALATATERDLVDAGLAHCGIADYFSAIVTCTDVGRSKTEPDIYLKALESLGAAVGECAVFEDAVEAARTAAAAGFYTVGVWDPTGAVNEDEMRRVCDEYIMSFLDLPCFAEDKRS